jgi:hypothetical protein
VVITRASSEVAAFNASGGSFMITWRDGSSVTLEGATGISFADGRLVLDGASPAARALLAYQAIGGSTPSPELVAQTTGLLERGVSMVDVAASLLGMPDWAARAAKLSAEEQILLIYKGVIGFSPAQDAMDYLMDVFRAGVPLSQLAAMLLNTPEAAAQSDRMNPGGVWLPDVTGRDVVRAYDAVLDMAPDPAALARWTLLLNASVLSLADVYIYLTRTDLFLTRHAGQINAEFVAAAYEQALERPAVAGELNWSTGLVDRGIATRLDILRSLGDMQTEIGQGPATPTYAQHTTYPAHQPDGEVLHAGESLADTAVSTSGHATTTRTAADLAGIGVAPDGLVLHWRNGEVMRLGGVDRLDFADGALELDGASQAALVTRLYEATIGFTPGAAGISAFLSLLDGGLSLETLTGWFLGTAESHARLGSLGASGQMTLLYQSLFGFVPAPETHDWLMGALQSGMAWTDLLVWLAQLPPSPTAFEQSHPTGVWVPDMAAAAVTRAYDTMLDTTPDPGSMLIWRAAVESSPGSLRILYETLMGTEIYTARHAGQTDAEWVAAHYLSALERDGTPGELAHSTGLVAQGLVSRLDMAVAIGELQPLPDPPRALTSGVDIL